MVASRRLSTDTTGAVAADIRTLLVAPTPRAARAVALTLLDALDAGYERLEKPGDPEALHDFRVALRRLRSWLRTYRRDVRDSVGRKSMRKLGALARATTESRDIEVHLEWLAIQQRVVKSAERVGIRWVARRLSSDKRRADAAFREALGAGFKELSARLRKNLSRYAVAVWDQSPEDRWAMTAAEQIQDAFLVFRRKLGDIEAVRDDEQLHAARIAGKRLRYLIEPLVEAVEGSAAAVEQLKQVQDLLGSVHDAHVFARTLKRLGRSIPMSQPTLKVNVRPGLRALAGRLTGRRTAAWRAFTNDWREGEFPTLSSHIHTLLQSLRDTGGVGVEIERKYLMRRLPAEAKLAPASEIEQGYVPGTELIERLRKVKTSQGVRYYRTVKTGSGLVRTELEEECTAATFKTMWPLTKGKRIRKRRYRIADAGYVWELDEFLDRRLVLAEIELRSARDEVPLPDWLARDIVREVTSEAAYLNHTMAS